jgi:hypothetical protein
MRSLPHSMLARLVLAACVAFSTCPAHADDMKCAAPPYGDAAWNYARLKQRFASIDEEKIDDVLEKLCRAKFEHVGRRDVHRLGITDRELAKETTTQLAAKVLSATHGGTEVL